MPLDQVYLHETCGIFLVIGDLRWSYYLRSTPAARGVKSSISCWRKYVPVFSVSTIDGQSGGCSMCPVLPVGNYKLVSFDHGLSDWTNILGGERAMFNVVGTCCRDSTIIFSGCTVQCGLA